jgi:hypothetical protein
MTTNDLLRLAPRPDQPPATPVHRRPITGPGAWKTTDFRSPRDYTIELTPTQLADIEESLRAVRAAGLGLDDIEQRHFALPTLAGAFEEIRQQVTSGRGFVILRRLPVERYTKDEVGMIYWGLGTHLASGCPRASWGTGSVTCAT